MNHMLSFDQIEIAVALAFCVHGKGHVTPGLYSKGCQAKQVPMMLVNIQKLNNNYGTASLSMPCCPGKA